MRLCLQRLPCFYNNTGICRRDKTRRDQSRLVGSLGVELPNFRIVTVGTYSPFVSPVRGHPADRPDAGCVRRASCAPAHDDHLRRERRLLRLPLLPRAQHLVVVVRRYARQHEAHPEEIFPPEHVPEYERSSTPP